MTKQEQIDELKENIRQGEVFERMGFDCDMMLTISRSLLAKLEEEAICQSGIS